MNHYDAVLGNQKPPKNYPALGGIHLERQFLSALETAKVSEYYAILYELVEHAQRNYGESDRDRLKGELLRFLGNFTQSEHQAKFALDCVKNHISFEYGEQRFFHKTFFVATNNIEEYHAVVRVSSVPLIVDILGKEGYLVYPKQYGIESIIAIHLHIEELQKISILAMPHEQQMLFQNAIANYEDFIKIAKS